MQTTRNSHYKSSYNTQPVTTQSTVELAKGKPILEAVMVQANSARQVTVGAGKARNSAFDFAGLAG
jgi:hypothetical protein